ncbi:rhodanese-like domain-containing protein [Spirochaetota bacterium]
MKITCEQLNNHSCKTYLIGIEGQNEVAFIDPVIEHVNDYVQLIKDNNLKVSKIIDSHTHADHISGGSSLKDIFDCDYVMSTKSPVQCATFRVSEGFKWKLFGQIPVKVIETPGHTRDSISLIFPEWIFTGDALFLDDGGAGRDDLPGGDPAAHYDSLRKLYDLPDKLIVYPAHDYRNRRPSSLAHQKKTNPHLKKSQGPKEDFVKFLEDLKLGPADWMNDVLKANYACARDPKAAWIPVDSPACEVKGTMDRNANEMQVASIPAAVLKQKLAGATPPMLIDVRETEELSGPLGSINGIIHIPITQLAKRIGELEMHKDGEIVIICRSGGRAHTGAQILAAAGFSNVIVLSGGMIDWNKL